MKRIVIVLLASLAVAAPAHATTVQLAVVHVMRGCHVFSTAAKALGASPRLTVKRGARIELRISCPMDFDVVQPDGQTRRFIRGTTTTLRFPRRGTFVYRLTNVQTPEEVGLQTLGTTNTLVLTVRVS